MKIYTYHAKVKEGFDVTNLISQLTSQEKIKLLAIKRKLLAIKCNYEKALKKRLSNLEISNKISTLISRVGIRFSDPFYEILLSESEKILIGIHEVVFGSLEIKVLSESKDKFTSLLELIKSFNGVKKFNYGTFSESVEAKELKKEFNLSPHGKKLKDRKYKKVFPKLYDNETREILSEIIKTYAGLPVPIEIVKDIEVVKKKEEIAKKIFKDKSLTSKGYTITCGKCDYLSNVTFNTKIAANKSLKNIEYTCPQCKKITQRITETFCVREEVIDVLEGGLWLEKFIGQIMEEETKNVWSGVTIDTNELDIVAILNEKIFLIECKVPSFGETALHVLLGKAGAIDANIVIIVTSKEVHENVKSAITKYQERGEREVYLIQSNIPEKISSALQDILRKEEERYIKSIFKPKIRRRLPIPNWGELTVRRRARY